MPRSVVTGGIQYFTGEWTKPPWRLAFPYILTIGIVWIVVVINTARELNRQLYKEADEFQPKSCCLRENTTNQECQLFRA